MKKFALVGAAGYIAPRHMKSIKDTGNILSTAYDKFDSVGILDSYFPEAAFFTEFERFDRHVEKLKRSSNKLDYVSICSPNYLHDAHIRFGLRVGADVICEKPLVLSPWNIDALKEIEIESGKKVYNILQLRLHPSIVGLKNRIDKSPKDKIFDIDLTYITSRGNWYFSSWKGDFDKSGGIATNIGVHFFDMLIWIFGDVKENILHIKTHDRVAGVLILERAIVRWFLSINPETLPDFVKEKGGRTFRSLEISGQNIEFSDGFTELHTLSYQGILNGDGFGLDDAKKSIQIVHDIGKINPIGLNGEFHPFAKL
jgi:UDP-N-acetyl-2-amino-2-deoxyglucuronate dehydrogenase